MFLRITFIIFTSSLLIAQSLPNIGSLKKEAKKLGITDQQINKAIESQSNRGLNAGNLNVEENTNANPEQEKKDVNEQISKITKTDISNDFGITSPTESLPVNVIDELVIESNILDTDSEIDIVANKILPSRLQHFGYNVFKNNPEIFQDAQDIFVNPDHVIGPGDEIILMLWGDTEINEKYIVSRDGYVFIENVGQVFVNGLTLQRLEIKLFNLLKKVYSTLDSISGNPSTFLDISIGTLTLRPLRIHAVGEVSKPGAYDLKQSSTLFTSLFYFGGPTEIGTLRDVKLIRNGKEKTSIDFYDYLIKGKRRNDEKLMSDDVIFISPKNVTVTVYGEINRPAIYELKGDEGLMELIDLAGGLKSSTYTKRIKINRIVPSVNRDSLNADRIMIDLSLENKNGSKDQFKLFDGDVVEFFKISDVVKNTVSIAGSVLRPGEYELNDEMKVSDLIDMSGGLSDDVYLQKADIIRSDEPFIEKLITVNLKNVLSDVHQDNLILKNNDKLTIYSISGMKYLTDVSINGHVISPGPKPYRENMKVEDLIFQGGGFENELHLKNTYLNRATLSSINQSDLTRDIVSFNLDSVLQGGGIAKREVKMGDIIRIYSITEILGGQEEIVTINGYVKFPGEYPLYNNLTLFDLIRLSGDFEDNEFAKSLYLKRGDIIRKVEGSKEKKIMTFSLNNYLKNNSIGDIPLIDGDMVKIYESNFFNDEQEVFIEGLVSSPGSYELKTNMRLFDLILEAGGLPSENYNFRVEVASTNYRTSFKDDYMKIKTFEILNDENIYLKNNSDKNNVLLKPFDIVTLRPSPLFSTMKKVVIDGFVHYPGTYIITSYGEKVSEIIYRAGGLTPNAYPRGSTFIRAGEVIRLSFEKIINIPSSNHNFVVMDGDSIIIGSKPNLVKIQGAVSAPGNYQYKKYYRLNDYISLAGGYTKEAEKSGVYVQHADGSSDKKNFIGISPKVYDGSLITVPNKQEAVPFNFTEYITNLTAIWADITQAVLILSALR